MISDKPVHQESFQCVRQFRLNQDRPKAHRVGQNVHKRIFYSLPMVQNRNVLLLFRFELWKSFGSGSGYRHYLAVFQKQINCTKSCLFQAEAAYFPER
jgi:hypothetical protein